MTLKKNSLWLLIGYLVIVSLFSLISVFFKTSSMLYTLLSLTAVVGTLILLYFNYQKARYRNWLEKSPRPWSISLLIVLGGLLAILVAQRVCLWIEANWLHQSIVSQNTAAMLTIISHYPIYLLYVVLAAPIMEELIFRKVLFGNLITMVSPMLAALISCLLFSIVHADGHYLTYTAIGAILCLIYYLTGRIQASMLTHVLMNLAIVLLNIWSLLK
ncbi:CPBP family intramembrane glutamic endopeptidase [Liquorilactobacillus vini]|uniref:CAAX family protease n=1 Tax=Liquorilactobacillus vini DSM 20605 TaxID=1133569 RepID=A0A0R2CDE0_9LACO|nr:type II CAAX endopeptidase family protein [Liquorilactobacillus vini]KRM89296.1 CAAX family protease [Liquorilactobacillus vini DSM 20605]